MTEEELDAAVDVIAAVNAGVLESLNQRVKQRVKNIKVLGHSETQNEICKSLS